MPKYAVVVRRKIVQTTLYHVETTSRLLAGAAISMPHGPRPIEIESEEEVKSTRIVATITLGDESPTEPT
jgi:hypothetical protein